MTNSVSARRRVGARAVTVTAMFSAEAFVLMFLEFSLPIIPSFVKMDVSELPALLAAFGLGPVYGVVVCLVKNLLHLLITTTLGLRDSYLALLLPLAPRSQTWFSAVGEAAGAEKREPVKEQASTGNPELDKMIRDGELAIREMRRLDESITDLGISADIVRLERASAKIFEEVRAHPEKLPQIRRFMDYYLPTTLKLLNAYDRMSGTGVSGENIDTTLSRVEEILRTVAAAFEKLLDSLYGAEALDISADITVLENMLAREGLTEDPLKAETKKAEEAPGTDIHLEL